MKRMIVLLLALSLLLCACSSSPAPAPAETARPAAETAAPVSAPTPEPTSTPEPAPAVPTLENAYRHVVAEREAVWGAADYIQTEYGSCLPFGVACAALQDLNGDGISELLLWEGTRPENNQPGRANIEVWTYQPSTGEAVELYNGTPLLGGDIGGQSLTLMQLDGEWMLMLGEGGGTVDFEYLALRNGRLQTMHTAKEDYSPSGSALLFDGSEMDYEAFWDMCDQYEHMYCNASLSDTETAQRVISGTKSTRQMLGL